MAKYENELQGDFQIILNDLESTIMNDSFSASKENESNFCGEGFKCAVRVFERYSWTGSNRVSLSITLLEMKDRIFVSAITSGGSQGVFLKINTLGEESFLNTISEVLNKYAKWATPNN